MMFQATWGILEKQEKHLTNVEACVNICVHYNCSYYNSKNVTLFSFDKNEIWLWKINGRYKKK